MTHGRSELSRAGLDGAIPLKELLACLAGLPWVIPLADITLASFKALNLLSLSLTGLPELNPRLIALRTVFLDGLPELNSDPVACLDGLPLSLKFGWSPVPDFRVGLPVEVLLSNLDIKSTGLDVWSSDLDIGRPGLVNHARVPEEGISWVSSDCALGMEYSPGVLCGLVSGIRTLLNCLSTPELPTFVPVLLGLFRSDAILVDTQ